jgi:hypothetical protein
MYNQIELYKLVLNDKLPKDVGGALYEKSIATQIKYYGHNLYFYGTPQMYSVDFVISTANNIYLIETKKRIIYHIL